MKKSRYEAINTKIWRSRDFLKLSEKARMLFLYILTSPHGNMGGFYYLPLGYISTDLGLDYDEIESLIKELEDGDLIQYDCDSSVVIIKKYLKHNPIENENQAKGLRKKLLELPDTDLIEVFIDLVIDYCKNKYINLIFEDVCSDGILEKKLRGKNTNEDCQDDNGYNSNSFNKNISKPFKTLSKPETEAVTGTVSVAEPGAVRDSEKTTGQMDVTSKSQNSEPFRAALYLRECILAKNHRASVPDVNLDNKTMKKWADEMDMLNRRGPVKGAEGQGYSWEEIYEMIDWCFEEGFWGASISSPAWLRKNIVKIENQWRLSKQNKINSVYAPNTREALLLKEKYKMEEQ